MKKSIFISLLAVLMLTAATSDKKTTIFVIGDSTAANKDTTGGKKERGWAMMLQGCFDADYIVVDNHAGIFETKLEIARSVSLKMRQHALLMRGSVDVPREFLVEPYASIAVVGIAEAA